jgi:hypothetical protein
MWAFLIKYNYKQNKKTIAYKINNLVLLQFTKTFKHRVKVI